MSSARVQLAVGRRDADTVGRCFPLPAQPVVKSVINPLSEHLKGEPDGSARPPLAAWRARPSEQSPRGSATGSSQG